MSKYMLTAFACLLSIIFFGQDLMTPELLWKLGRVTGHGISNDGSHIVYSVSVPDAEQNRSTRKYYMIPLQGGQPVQIRNSDSLVRNKNISPDGKYILSNKEVKIKKVFGNDHYPDLPKS